MLAVRSRLQYVISWRKTMRNVWRNHRTGFIIVCVLVVLMLIAGVCFLLRQKGAFPGQVVLTVETPDKQVAGSVETFTVDVTLSTMKDGIYPAASASIIFDPSHLEFLGIEDGDIMVSGETRADGGVGALPEWQVNTARSNETGRINVLYLDTTGGKYAFSKEYMQDDSHVLFRLAFRLRATAKPGDVYELSVEDAVLAAIEEDESLALTSGTLKTRNGRILIQR